MAPTPVKRGNADAIAAMLMPSRGTPISIIEDSGSSSDEDEAVPRIHIDYWFMKDNPGADLILVVTAKGDASKTVKAHVVPGKRRSGVGC